jgi:hypothetical protein
MSVNMPFHCNIIGSEYTVDTFKKSRYQTIRRHIPENLHTNTIPTALTVPHLNLYWTDQNYGPNNSDSNSYAKI